MNNTVTILLATYNGEKYINHQLNSILKQSYTNWRLLIRDDHSTDNTISIIEQCKKKYPDKINILQNTGNNAGSSFNFSALLEAAADKKYIMFCDQDDEWQSDKIELTLQTMIQKEKEYGSHHPLLVFTNFQYVDESLQIIESKKHFRVNKQDNLSFSHLLANNPVYGCTMMINRVLAEKVKYIPPEAENHDYWIALVASIYGNIIYLQEKTLLYRQHQKNVSGNFDNDSLKKRMQRIVLRKNNFTILSRKKKMLLKLKEIYGSQMDENKRTALNDFIEMYTHKSIFAFAKNIKRGIVSQTVSQTFLLYITMLFYKDKNKESN